MQTLAPLKFLLLIPLALTLWACGVRHPVPDPIVPPAIPDRANPNAAALRDFAQGYAPGSEEARAASFLVENLPLADALSLTAADLRENLDHAFLARQLMPWGKTVPWDVFLHYVLPHRASQEPFQPHRAFLFAELAPLCATALSMEEALSRVGGWCAARAEYRPTSRRDLGVQAILDGGYGRCEETNILFLAAARAVGLPVRQAMVPWWQHADGNHAWIEAWTEKGWRFLESGTEFSALNRTWFAAQAPRMPKVVAHVLGHPQDPQVYRTGPGFALVDSTAAYAPATDVEVRVVSTEPVNNGDVYFSVFSLGGLRPVTRSGMDPEGQARTTLGPGVFFVSTRAEEGLAWALINTHGQDRVSLSLDARTAMPLPESMEFSWPETARDGFDATPRPELVRLRQERSTRWAPLLGDLPQALLNRLLLAGTRTPGWLQALHGASSDLRSWLEACILNLDDKDMLEADPAGLAREVGMALQAREQAAATGLVYPDALFTEYVLAPRIFLEPWSPWRAQLRSWLGQGFGLDLEKKLALLHNRLNELGSLRPALFGPPLTPGQTHAGGYCGLKQDKIVLATAALRVLGIAARCQPDFGGVEYHDGRTWKFWEFDARPQASGSVHILSPDPLNPLKDFGVARIQDGYLRTLDDLPWEETADGLRCALQPGPYVLLTAMRTGNRARVNLASFSVEAGSETRLHAGSTTP